MFHLNQSFSNTAFLHNNFFISCKESRIETNRSFYGSFYLGPFDSGQSITIANALRRTLLSELKGIAITAVEIEGALHEYSNISGIRDSVLDILLNLKEIVLKKNAGLNISASCNIENKTTHIGYLKARGPGVVRASDLKLPASIQSVDPEQYIATLSEDGVLNMKFYINEGKNYIIQTPKRTLESNKTVHFVPAKGLKGGISLFNILPIDAVFMPVNKVNYIIEPNEQLNDFYSVASSATQNNLSLTNSGILNTSYQSDKLLDWETPSNKKMDNVSLLINKKTGLKSNSLTALANNGRKPSTGFWYTPDDNNSHLAQKSLEMKTLKGFNIKHNIVLEIWTNGSIHPRQALYDSFKSLLTTFSKLYKIKMLGSMFKSDITYNKLLKTNYAMGDSVQDISHSDLETPYELEDLILEGIWDTSYPGRDNSMVNTSSYDFSQTDFNSVKKLYFKTSSSFSSTKFTQYTNNGVLKRSFNKAKNDKELHTGNSSNIETEQTSWQTSSTIKGGLRNNIKSTNKLHVLQLDIGTLNMSLRPYTCLKKANLNTIGDLIKLSRKQFLEIKNFGKRSLEEVEQSLSELGFELLD